jgi:hypothetical protein
MKALDPFEYIKLIYELTYQYIPSPWKEILLGAFGAFLLIGLVYGLFFRGFASRASVDQPEENGENAGTTRRDQLRDAKREVRELQARLEISPLERYYLYFNGIANASLMLALSVLVDRLWTTGQRDSLPIKQQISSFVSILLVGLFTSVILNVLIDLLAGPPSRRTDTINRAFLIAFAINALVFVAYHMNYLNL